MSAPATFRDLASAVLLSRRVNPTNISLQDIITGDELISDVYNLKEIDGAVDEADCRKITIGNDNVDIGANPSAEGGDDDGGDESNAQTVIDVVHSFRLNETQFDKKGYLSHLKGFMKTVKEKMKAKGASEDEVKEFEKGAGAYAKKIVGSFKDYEFLIGESMDPDGMYVDLSLVATVLGTDYG